MMDISNLARTINEMLSEMDDHHAQVKKAMGVHPDLEVAAVEADKAHALIEDLAVLIMKAESEHGVKQPPDVIQRINEVHAELHVIAVEIQVCLRVVEDGDHRCPQHQITEKNSN